MQYGPHYNCDWEKLSGYCNRVTRKFSNRTTCSTDAQNVLLRDHAIITCETLKIVPCIAKVLDNFQADLQLSRPSSQQYKIIMSLVLFES